MRSRCLALLLSLVSILPASAQETRGTILGTVRDAEGVVPGATVTITSLDTRSSQTLQTNGSGYFEAPLLQPGTYEITVAMTGFKTLSQTGLVLAVGQQLSLPLKIEIGQVAETVTVVADTPLLDTSSVSSGQNFDSRMVEGLPMFSNMPGKRISVSGQNGPWLEIVGVTEDGRYIDILDDTLPYFFLPLWQNPRAAAIVLVRSRGSEPSALVPVIRSVVRDVNPSLPVSPVYDVTLLDDVVGVGLLPQRLAASWLGIFGAIALLLAAIGLYGVLAHAVSLRRREIGLRIAVGAEPRAIVFLFLSQGLRVVAIGLVIGLAVAFVGTQLLSSLLYEVSPTDPLTFVVTSVIFAMVAFAATYVPARRAARLDPIRLLRQE